MTRGAVRAYGRLRRLAIAASDRPALARMVVRRSAACSKKGQMVCVSVRQRRRCFSRVRVAAGRTAVQRCSRVGWMLRQPRPGADTYGQIPARLADDEESSSAPGPPSAGGAAGLAGLRSPTGSSRGHSGSLLLSPGGADSLGPASWDGSSTSAGASRPGLASSISAS